MSLTDIEEYESVVKKIIENPDIPLDANSTRILDRLVSELNKDDDFLYLATCLQIIADLSTNGTGLSLLYERGVPNKLINLLQKDDPLIVPHVLKFFCQVYPQEIEDKHPQVMQKVFEYFDSVHVELLRHAIDFLAVLARSGYTTRQSIDKRYPFEFRKKCLRKLGSLLKCSNDNLKVRTLECIRDLIAVEPGEPTDLSESIYLYIIEGEGMMTSQLVALCKQPFNDIRNQAMLLVSTVASQIWGQKELANNQQFIQWISLGSSTEVNKACKDSKFEIVKTLSQSKTISQTFPGPIVLRLRQIFKRGPSSIMPVDEMQIDQQHS